MSGDISNSAHILREGGFFQYLAHFYRKKMVNSKKGRVIGPSVEVIEIHLDRGIKEFLFHAIRNRPMIFRKAALPCPFDIFARCYQSMLTCSFC
jgi:hypothetical protein